ncbi:MAG: DUF262 domain-containing protein [Cyanobacteriota bacterium]|nr:DUF262 domain-containing protein [Cyanobacteriota bacterium]
MLSQAITNKKQEITEQQKEAAEAEIREKQKLVDYLTREYPLEVLVQKYMEGKDDDTNEFFITDDRREIAWDDKRRSKFVEYVLLGLPIPFIFVANIYDRLTKKSRLEIINGTQIILAMVSFINNELTLQGLEKLVNLNNCTFADLLYTRQRRLERTTVRIVEIGKKTDEQMRQYLFEIKNMDLLIVKENVEKLKEIQGGPFID